MITVLSTRPAVPPTAALSVISSGRQTFSLGIGVGRAGRPKNWTRVKVVGTPLPSA